MIPMITDLSISIASYNILSTDHAMQLRPIMDADQLADLLVNEGHDQLLDLISDELDLDDDDACILIMTRMRMIMVGMILNPVD
jgi:hypothetical protein